jgi:PAS domain S-box-containing protein
MTPASILIVEDEAIVALDLRTQLEDLGYDVIGIADQAEDALKIAAAQRPDLVLMDVRLKGPTDGIHTAGILNRMYQLPVIYLTAHSDDETVQRAAGTAPYGYLTKPFQIRELHAAIEVALTKAAMERQLQDSERWFASTLQCVNDGVMLTHLDGGVRFMNPSAELLTGWTNELARGHAIGEVVRFRRGGVDAAAEPQPSDAVSRALDSGEVVGIDHARRLVTRDGREVAVDQSASPINDQAGRRLGAVLVLRDATRRLEQEARLRASEERFRSAFDHAPLGMALVAFDGRMLQVNSALCQLLGAPADVLRQRRNEGLTWPADREHEQLRLRSLLERRERVVQFEKRYRHADGHTALWALVSVSLLLEDDRPTCWLYQVHDLTEQKKAAEQVAELATERMRRQASEMADKAKSDFLSRASHEMRTPLNAVLGFAHLLQQEGTTHDPERMKRFARQIATAGEHLLVMVNDVLDLQRAAQGQLRLRMATVSLADAVGAACDLLGSQAQGAQVRIEREVERELMVRADDTRLRQVLLNVGSNAIKYNRPGGRVGMKAWRLEPDRVRLEVSDTGIGMTAEQTARLFQPFDRLGRERSDIPGTGLGLLIARNLVLEMGGRLEVHSEPEQGTRVVLDLLPG